MTTSPMPTGRLVLTPAQRAVADELFGALSATDLVVLAKALPYAAVAAVALWGGPGRTVDSFNFDKIVGTGSALEASSQFRRYLVAAYCACAAENGVAKVLLEMEELTKQKKKKLNGLLQLIHFAEVRGLPRTKAAMKGDDDADA